mmetsp:Transcript_5401/g.9080  ORF Transcript_5401/g.9080 Transcript_5401/m.9080 type:complete len:159 (-) Transcript_5401:535-1011(-)
MTKFDYEGIVARTADSQQPLLQNEQSGHAFLHYEETMHVYAMEIETKKVWDFSKENFVSRLILNDVDGKMLEHTGQAESEHANFVSSEGGGVIDENGQISSYQKKDGGKLEAQSQFLKGMELDSVHMFNKKIESLNHEYNTILVKTLEEQRKYFEAQL